MTGPLDTPVRRSALHAVHEQLGATWIAPGIAWPASYAQPSTELAAARDAVVLGEVGPIDKLSIRGPGTSETLAALGVTSGLRNVTQVRLLDIWLLGREEALVLSDATSTEGATSLADFAARAHAAGATVTDMSSGLTVLRLVGPGARRVLRSVDPVDMSDAAFPDRSIVAAPVAGVRVTMARLDVTDVPGFTMLVNRDEAAYLWSALLDVGTSHGITPVGAVALRPPGTTRDGAS